MKLPASHFLKECNSSGLLAAYVEWSLFVRTAVGSEESRRKEA